MLNSNDKVDEKGYEEKKDDVDDADKVVRLAMKIIISKIYDNFIVLINQLNMFFFCCEQFSICISQKFEPINIG